MTQNARKTDTNANVIVTASGLRYRDFDLKATHSVEVPAAIQTTFFTSMDRAEKRETGGVPTNLTLLVPATSTQKFLKKAVGGAVIDIQRLFRSAKHPATRGGDQIWSLDELGGTLQDFRSYATPEEHAETLSDEQLTAILEKRRKARAAKA